MKLFKSKKIIARFLERFWPHLLFKMYQPSIIAQPELGLIPIFCEKNKVSIDVGANRGLYSQEMIKHSKECWAFEPNPVLADNLRRMFKSKLKVEQLALSNEGGQVNIRIPLDYPGRATIEDSNTLEDYDLDDPNQVKIISITKGKLDDYQFDPVSFIKIDVEGHEKAVLEGAINLITKNKPAILLEAEERHKPNSLKEISEFLEKLGYSGYFFFYGKLENLKEFNIKEHQNPKNKKRSTKMGPYVENFIFVDSSKKSKISKLIR